MPKLFLKVREGYSTVLKPLRDVPLDKDGYSDKPILRSAIGLPIIFNKKGEAKGMLDKWPIAKLKERATPMKGD